ncbi:MAG: (2Fe-2S)-binding protein [bacterium]
MIASSESGRFDLELTVNGKIVRKTVSTRLRLLDFLRDELHLTGAKEVCAEGECGACTILLDGKSVNSCLILAVEAHGCDIVTIEGVGDRSEYAGLIDAFVEKHSVQCGYCIPGMVMSGVQVLQDHPHPAREDASQGLAGNTCRCTGYHKILDAVVDAGEKRK